MSSRPCCDHHSTPKPAVPWTPRKVRFSGNSFDGGARANIPSLIPLKAGAQGSAQGPSSTVISGQFAQRADADADAVAFQAQLQLNTKMMADLEQLKKDMGLIQKQRDVYKMQLDQSNERLEYLKKKINKNNDENADPNAAGGNGQ